MRLLALVTFMPVALGAQAVSAPEQLVQVPLTYHAPVDGQPKPNFSPKGMQVALTAVPRTVKLPVGAVRPAKRGMLQLGATKASWVPVLATASKAFPTDLVQLWIDRNRNGNFSDDGPALTGTPAQNAKTRAWWTSFNKVELPVRYSAAVTEPYFVNFWVVRNDSAETPEVIRFSTGSWRGGTVTVNGVPALVAAMDSDNNAIFDAKDTWSVLAASLPKAEQAVLSIAEARSTNRLMFLPTSGKELVLEFRRFSPDGRSVDFAVIDKPVTSAQDRAPDDQLREERPRPRTTVAFAWAHGSAGLDAALAQAKTSGKKLFLDFEATWCGPCHTMDEWIWTDAEVAAKLNAEYLGVKIDVDLEKPLVKRFGTSGYPTMIILNPDGSELKRVVEYQSSSMMLKFLATP